MGFVEFLKENFLHAFPILVAGGFALAIIVERVNALFVVLPISNPTGFFQRISELVLTGKVSDALNVCDAHPNKPLAQVVKAALVRAHLPESMIEHGLEFAVGEASQAIQKRTSFLATIANVATLLGLFGTILGLVHSFEAVGHADAQQKSALLAAGIATAMNATMLGLAVAIPCMIAYSFLVNRTNRLIAEVEHSGIRTLELLKQRYYSLDYQSKASDESAEASESGKVVSMRKSA